MEKKFFALIDQLNSLQERYNELAGEHASPLEDYQSLKRAYEDLQREVQ